MNAERVLQQIKRRTEEHEARATSWARAGGRGSGEGRSSSMYRGALPVLLVSASICLSTSEPFRASFAFLTYSEMITIACGRPIHPGVKAVAGRNRRAEIGSDVSCHRLHRQFHRRNLQETRRLRICLHHLVQIVRRQCRHLYVGQCAHHSIVPQRSRTYDRILTPNIAEGQDEARLGRNAAHDD